MINPIVPVILLLIYGFLTPLLYGLIKIWYKIILLLLIAFAISVYTMLLPLLYSNNYTVILGGIKPPYGIALNFTFLNLILSIIISVFAFLIIILKMNKYFNFDNERVFYTVFPILLTASISLINAIDIFNIFVFIEIITISVYILGGIKKNSNSDLSVIKFITGTSIGSLFMLLGIAAIYRITGTLNLNEIANVIITMKHSLFLFHTGLFIFLFGMLFELYILPGNLFVIGLYANSNSINNSIYSGIIQTTMLLVFIKIFTMLSFNPIFNNIVFFLAITTFLLSEFSALYSKNKKRMLGFSSFAQSGLIVSLIVFSTMVNRDNALFGIVLLILVFHAICKFMLFISINKFIDEKGNIIVGYKNAPFTGIAFIIAALTLMGIPPFAGFFIKFNLLVELLRLNALWFVVIILLGTFIEIIYFVKTIREIFINTHIIPEIYEKFYTIIPAIIILAFLFSLLFNPQLLYSGMSKFNSMFETQNNINTYEYIRSNND